VNTTAIISIVLAIIAVVGTLLGTLITQITERGRMREQHELELEDERVRWTRDRRADLYIRITTLLQEMRRTFDDMNSTGMRLGSNTEKLNSLTAQMAPLVAEVNAATADLEAQRQAGVATVTTSEEDNLKARSEQLKLQYDKLTAEGDRLRADSETQIAQLKDIRNNFSDQRWALVIVGSEGVRNLADVVLGEIVEAVNAISTGKSKEFDYGNWTKLNDAMRADLQILD
jgi:hypothetical protein